MALLDVLLPFYFFDDTKVCHWPHRRIRGINTRTDTHIHHTHRHTKTACHCHSGTHTQTHTDTHRHTNTDLSLALRQTSKRTSRRNDIATHITQGRS